MQEEEHNGVDKEGYEELVETKCKEVAEEVHENGDG